MIIGNVATWLFELSIICQISKIMALAKYGHLMLPGAFPDKWTPDIDFKDDAVVQYDVPVVKILL